MDTRSLGGTGTRILAMMGAATLAVTALAGTASAAGPGKVPTTCNGKTPTQHITDVSQFDDFLGGYGVNGTPGNDVILVYVDIPTGNESLYINMTPWHVSLGNVGGGTDDVCVVLKNGILGHDSTFVQGGANVAVKGSWFSNVQPATGATVYVSGPRVNVFSTGAKPTKTTVASEADGYQGPLFAEVQGTSANDDISVTVADDSPSAYVAVNGSGGNDTIAVTSLATTDSLIVGGAGADVLSTGEGDDLVYGSDVSYSRDEWAPGYAINSFDDAATALLNRKFATLSSLLAPLWASDAVGNTISTGDGNDIVYGSDGYDELRTGAGNDWADAGRHRDRVWGGSGNDTLLGGPDNDDVYGENGIDTLYGETGNDTVKGGTGSDKVYGDAGNDDLYGNEDDDRVYGGDGNDTLWGNAGDDYLRGDDGEDTLDGDTGNDNCSGGAGDDILRRCNP